MPAAQYGLRRSGIARLCRVGTGRILIVGDSVTNANNHTGAWSANGQSALGWAMMRRFKPDNGIESLLAQGSNTAYPFFQRLDGSGTGYSTTGKNNSPTVAANRQTVVGARTNFALSDFRCVDMFTGGSPWTTGTAAWELRMNLDQSNYRHASPADYHPAIRESFTAQLLYLQHTEGPLQVTVGIGRNGSISQSTAAFDMNGAQSVKLSPAIGTPVAAASTFGLVRLTRTAVPDVTNRQAVILGALIRFGGRSQGNGLGIHALGTGSSTHANWFSNDVGDLTPQAGTGVFGTDATLTEYLNLLRPDVIVHAYGYNDAADNATWTTNRTDIVDRFETCAQAASLTSVKHWLWTPYACTSLPYTTVGGCADRDMAIAAAGTANVPPDRMASTALHMLTGQFPQAAVSGGRGRVTPFGDQVHPTCDASDYLADRVWELCEQQA